MFNKKINIERIRFQIDNSYTELPKELYSVIETKDVSNPSFVMFNESLAESLGLDFSMISDSEKAEIFCGNIRLPNSIPIAQAYGGHQFGRFTFLGDGRALLLGEHITPDGSRVDIQLKGSGPTPYSRGGDGLAALGPMLREYLISEAMAALNIPTTRSLAVVLTNQRVHRQVDLDGAVLTRIAKSHIRVGTFQYALAQGGVETLRALADYTIHRHFPNINDENRYLELLNEVIKAQAKLIAQWQLVGFIHGVMNTDNMAISGETIDYGPCAWLDTYEPKTVFSSIDYSGRYAFINQPAIAAWNLARFAETLLPLLEKDQFLAQKMAQDAVETFLPLFKDEWLSGMRKKLGLFSEEVEDEGLIDELLNIMHKQKLDYHLTFVNLTTNIDAYDSRFEFAEWLIKYRIRRSRQRESLDESIVLMKSVNPAIVPRNHLVEEALSHATEHDLSKFNHLLELLKTPFQYSSEQLQANQPASASSVPYKTYCGT
ncbi:MAG: YdiU family protein [Erysipelotrichaceae bacterium]|nr:YdiU family protein [Erysipelotrichaceae bacterium]